MDPVPTRPLKKRKTMPTAKTTPPVPRELRSALASQRQGVVEAKRLEEEGQPTLLDELKDEGPS